MMIIIIIMTIIIITLFNEGSTLQQNTDKPVVLSICGFYFLRLTSFSFSMLFSQCRSVIIFQRTVSFHLWVRFMKTHLFKFALDLHWENQTYKLKRSIDSIAVSIALKIEANLTIQKIMCRKDFFVHYISFSKPFPSYSKPLFQSEAKCKTIDTNFILMQIQSNPALRKSHYYEQFSSSLGKESPYIFSKFNPL